VSVETHGHSQGGHLGTGQRSRCILEDSPWLTLLWWTVLRAGSLLRSHPHAGSNPSSAIYLHLDREPVMSSFLSPFGNWEEE
jgi:hypothetical protein